MDGLQIDILVIGAGMAGLTCATELAKAGRSVSVIDKGRGPGGRMAARRAEIAGQVVSFDHGAQYFTARDPAFQDAVSQWEEQGVVARWSAAGEEAWVGVPGMNGPIRAMAEPLDVHWSIRAESITHESGSWQVGTGSGTLTAQTVLIAIPAEQTSELLRDANPDFAAIAGSVRSEPCWAAMAAFDQPLPIAEDTLRNPGAAISWAARNSAKPARNGVECWVLHASPARSREVLDLPKEDVAPILLGDFLAQTGMQPAEAIHCVAHRWLYAMPSKADGEPARYDAEARLGIAGDYLHSPRVEGAFLSGLALAEKAVAAP